MNEPNSQTLSSSHVIRLSDVTFDSVRALLTRYGLHLRMVAASDDIPGSFWGDEEAGLLGNQLMVRPDTPLHSVLHEACHFICMDKTRREGLDTDAGGDYDEENAVCYLQILLSDYIEGFGRQRAFADMDSWGYSFRLGSAQAWFERDAEDALGWLLQNDLLDKSRQPRWTVRQG